MTSGTIVKDNQIIISSGLTAAGLMMGLGCAIFTGGLFGDLPTLAAHAVAGAGVMIAGSGINLYLNSRRYRVVITGGDKSITIIESGIRRKNCVEIPISHYTGVLVQRKTESVSSAKGSSSPHVVLLISEFGSTLLISEHKGEEPALEFAKTLQSRFNLNIYNEDELIQLMRTRRKSSSQTIEVQLPPKPAVSWTVQDDTVSLNWRIRRDPVNLLSGAVIIYGVFHIIYFAAIPCLEKSYFLYLLYAGIATVTMLFLSIGGVNLAGSFHLELSKDRISYYIQLFGKKIGKRGMECASIAQVRNSIGGTEEKIQVMSARGLIAIRKISDKLKGDSSASQGLSMIGDFMTLKDGFIDIQVKSLSLAEKIFIEEMILRQLPDSG